MLHTHEVTGSSPVVSTKKKDTTNVVSFFLVPFDHFTAGMNPAYDNSPLRSESTRHPARPPEGGFTYSLFTIHSSLKNDPADFGR